MPCPRAATQFKADHSVHKAQECNHKRLGSLPTQTHVLWRLHQQQPKEQQAGPDVSLQGAAPAVRTYPLHLVLPCMHQANFWSIRQNDCFLGLVRREVQLPPSLSSTAPCSSPVHLRKDRLATSPLHDMDCNTILYSQLGSEPHSAIYSTNMWKTLTLCWENTRKTTESSQVITNVQTVNTNGQIPGKKSMFKSLFTMSFSATAYL